MRVVYRRITAEIAEVVRSAAEAGRNIERIELTAGEFTELVTELSHMLFLADDSTCIVKSPVFYLGVMCVRS